MAGKTYIRIDTSDVQETIYAMRMALTKREFELLMWRAFSRTGRHARTLIRKAVRRKYEVPAGFVNKAIGKPKMEYGGLFGASVSCSIPIDGARGIIGGTFKTNKPPKKGKQRKYIRAQIVKGMSSKLPNKMDHQGGQPPFFKGELVFTRAGKQRFPIARVAGLGVPQMPINRAKKRIEAGVIDMLSKRIEQEYKFLMKRCQ